MSRLAATFERLRDEQAGEAGAFSLPDGRLSRPGRLWRAARGDGRGGSRQDRARRAVLDPLADGATFQASATWRSSRGTWSRWRWPGARPAAALARAGRSDDLLQPAARLRPGAPDGDGAAAGIDGLIVPDLPLEEAAPLQRICRDSGLDLVCMLAPTSTEPRSRRRPSWRVASSTVWRWWVWPERARSCRAIYPEFMARVRKHSRQPLVVGFGISRPEHVAAMRGQADGVIVASALADLIERAPASQRTAAVAKYVGGLKAASRA